MRRPLALASLIALSSMTLGPAHASEQRTARLCVAVTGTLPSWLASSTRDSVTLATEQWQARFKHIGIALRAPLALDDGADAGLASGTARTCVNAADVFGYIGPQLSSVAPASMPILNRAGMAQITQGATRPSLTSPAFRASLEPLTASHRLSTPTFFRPLPTDIVEYASVMSFVKVRLHAQTYFLIRDVDPTGTVFDSAVESYGKLLGMQESGSVSLDPANLISSADAVADAAMAHHPDAVIFGATSTGKVLVPYALRKKGYKGPIMEGEPLFDDAAGADPTTHGLAQIDGPQHLLSTMKNLYTVNSGVDPSAASAAFRTGYQRRFHGPPLPFSNYAYDAANILLSSIYGVATHVGLHGSLRAMRAAVTTRVAHISWKGTAERIAFNKNGDARHPHVSVYRTDADRLTYVGVAPPVQVKATN